MNRVAPDSALGRALDARRESINGRVALARRAHPRLEPGVVLDFIAETLPPICDAVAALAPERAGEIVERLLDVALPLLGRDLMGRGARTPLLNWGWEALLPAWPALLLEDPVRLTRAISNALYNLGSQSGARPLVWIEGMERIGATAGGVGELLEAGQLLAWRCGMAQYRSSALGLARRLSPAQVGAALGLPLASAAARDAALDRLAADPWDDPGQAPGAPRRLQVVAETGGFRGLGGPFVSPPTVQIADGGFVVRDRASCYTLSADRYGAAFLRTTAPPEAPRPAGGLVASLAKTLLGPKPLVSAPEHGLSVGEDGVVSWGRQTLPVAALVGASSAAFDGRTLAITHPMSHQVFLVAMAPEATP